MPLDAIGPYADLMSQHGFIPADHQAPKFFPVVARKLYDETGAELPGYKRIVREDTNVTLNVASDSYKIITNEEAFGAFEDAMRTSALDLTDMQIGTDYAGGGLRCFRQYLFPAHVVEVKKNVPVALRLLMMNSYDGSVAFQGRVGAFNFVCANTSVSGNEFASFKMKHTGTLDVVKAVEGLTRAAELHITEADRMKAWPKVKITDTKAREIFGALPWATRMLVDHLVHRWVIARDGDAVQGGPNLWCLFNVLSAWSTHGETKEVGGRGQIKFEREQRVSKLIASDAWKEVVAA